MLPDSTPDDPWTLPRAVTRAAGLDEGRGGPAGAAWVARFALAHPDRAPAELTAAAWATSRDQAIAILTETLQTTGWHNIRVEAAAEATAWPMRAPLDAEAAMVVRSVHPAHPLTFGALLPQRPACRGAHLAVRWHDGVAPLDRQFGVRPRKTVPDLIRDPVFGTDDAATYAVMDAGMVPMLADRLAGSGLPWRSLFGGQAERDLAEVAPCLVRLTERSDLTRALFSRGGGGDLWDAAPALLIRAQADFDTMRNHLRRLTRIEAEGAGGRWFFLRFWPPRIASHILGALAHDPALLRQFFVGNLPVPARFLLIDPEAARLAEVGLAGAGVDLPRARPRLGPALEGALARAAWMAQAPMLADWAAEAVPALAAQPAVSRLRLARHVCEIGASYGLAGRDELAWLLHMMAHLGGWFHQAPPHRAVAQVLRSGGDRLAGLQDLWDAEYARSPAVLLAEAEAADNASDPAVSRWLAMAAADDPALWRELAGVLGGNTPEAEALATRYLPDPGGLTGSEARRYRVAALRYGYRFEDDPFGIWAEMLGAYPAGAARQRAALAVLDMDDERKAAR